MVDLLAPTIDAHSRCARRVIIPVLGKYALIIRRFHNKNNAICQQYACIPVSSWKA